jgi:hypothetical protein
MFVNMVLIDAILLFLRRWQLFLRYQGVNG